MAKVGSAFQVSDLRSAFQVIKLKPIMQHLNKQKKVLSNLKYLQISIHILRKVNTILGEWAECLFVHSNKSNLLHLHEVTLMIQSETDNNISKHLKIMESSIRQL